jgi:hypothetical protein
MIDNKTYSLKDIIKTGLLSGLIALSLSVIGFITPKISLKLVYSPV